MSLFSGILDLIYPPRCAFCRKFVKSNSKLICPDCEKNLPYTSNGGVTTGDFFSVCVSPLYYRDTVRESLHRYKFKSATGYSKIYAEIMAKCISDELSGRYDLISWVPLSSQRRKERGYDQAMILAMAVALELDDVAVCTLEKTVDVAKQSTVGSREKRRANISGAYKTSDKELIAGRRILLIDDIVTTGATLSECARTLLQDGAEEVLCATVAKAGD